MNGNNVREECGEMQQSNRNVNQRDKIRQRSRLGLLYDLDGDPCPQVVLAKKNGHVQIILQQENKSQFAIDKEEERRTFTRTPGQSIALIIDLFNCTLPL